MRLRSAINVLFENAEKLLPSTYRLCHRSGMSQVSVFARPFSYDDSLSMFNMASLEDRRIAQCKNFFDSIVSNSDHKLHHFLSRKNYCHYNLRRQRHFANPVMRTKRFCSTFLPSMCRRHLRARGSCIKDTLCKVQFYKLELWGISL